VLAERVGCSLAAIKKIESDERRPSRQIAERSLPNDCTKRIHVAR